MPNLAQMYSLCNSRTGYSRSSEIFPALNEAGEYVYNEVANAFQGTFLKFDTTSVVLQPGTQVYALPPDLEQLVHLAERQSSADQFAPMLPQSIGDALEAEQESVNWWGNYAAGYSDELSQFSYYGPYLDSVDATTTVQQKKINVSPAIDVVRMVEIAYIAVWLPITSLQSPLMLPVEGTNAMMNYAIAELHRANDDTLARDYEAKADKYLANFLKVLRQRQIQQNPQVDSYLL